MVGHAVQQERTAEPYAYPAPVTYFGGHRSRERSQSDAWTTLLFDIPGLWPMSLAGQASRAAVLSAEVKESVRANIWAPILLTRKARSKSVSQSDRLAVRDIRTRIASRPPTRWENR